MDNTHKIVPVRGHYEVYDSKGNFVLSGDTYNECYKDLIEMIVSDVKKDIQMENIREKVSAWEKGMYIIVKLSEKVFWKKLSS